MVNERQTHQFVENCDNVNVVIDLLLTAEIFKLIRLWSTFIKRDSIEHAWAVHIMDQTECNTTRPL